MTILVALPQLSWAFARQEFARLLNLTVEEADERFIATLHSAMAATFEAMLQPSEATASEVTAAT